MADGIAAALATDGLVWLLAAAGLAGLVYGFAGFGAALVFIPLAGILVPPPTAVALLSVTTVGSAVVVFPRAWGAADRRQVAWMLLPGLAALPAGVWVLGHTDVTALRWGISGLVGLTVVALMAGWRRQVAPTPLGLAGLGLGAGGIGGATGMHGPVVILFNLSGAASPEVMRANMLMVLTSFGICMIPVLAVQGHLGWVELWLGVLATPASMAGVALGQAAFDPARVRLYRGLGYAIVAAAAVAGLPVWG